MPPGGVTGAGASHRKRGRVEDVDDQKAVGELASEVEETEEGKSGVQESVDGQDEANRSRRPNHNLVIMSRMICADDYKVAVYMIGLVPL